MLQSSSDKWFGNGPALTATIGSSLAGNSDPRQLAEIGDESGPGPHSQAKGPLHSVEPQPSQYICCRFLSLCWILFCKTLYRLDWTGYISICIWGSLLQGPCSLLHQISPHTAHTAQWQSLLNLSSILIL